MGNMQVGDKKDLDWNGKELLFDMMEKGESSGREKRLS